ncbi:MAG: SH3 domain-containing protein [Leptolyngbyaceae cyanobacterium]
MKRLRTFGIVFLLSTSALLGCGQKDAAIDNPATESETPAAETTETDAAETVADETAAAAPDSPTVVETAINPAQSATLKAAQADAQINLREQPTTQAKSKGYGLVGDPIQLLKAAEGEQGLTWYYVKFDGSGAEGWVRGDFVNTSGQPAGGGSVAAVSVDGFTTDELFAVGSGGCGMTLWTTNAGIDDYIFFNGLPNEDMWMKLDGTMTKFQRTAASGGEFYGQTNFQSFVSLDGSTEVDVTVTVGTEEGYESVNIEQGTLRLESSSGVVEKIVVGDAGC